jgi:hypothetical protein
MKEIKQKKKKKSRNEKPLPHSLTPSSEKAPAAETKEKYPPLKQARENESLHHQPKTMELSHRSHSHPARKLTDYLFEFLMLFLAVIAGFLVENEREHYIENKRARQFSQQLLIDLRQDSALFENRNRDIQLMQKGYDSLQYLLTQKNEATDKEVLETLLPVAFAFDIPAVTTTYNQMKASGSLRYIDDINLVTHLQNYYDVLLPRSIKITDASLAYFSEHINPFYLNHIRIQDIDPFNDTLKNKDPLIIGRTRETDQQLANIMGGYKSLLTIQTITMNAPALKKLKETMALLKKEYQIK